jgi:hypothetical protein
MLIRQDSRIWYPDFQLPEYGMILMMSAGWLDRHRQDLIEYLKEETRSSGRNSVLKMGPPQWTPQAGGIFERAFQFGREEGC